MRSSATSSPPIGFGDIGRRIHAAVAGVAATEPDPLDPFRGLYISDGDALRLAGGDWESDVDGRDAVLLAVARRLGLAPLDTALLALCAAPELDARYGRLVAYLQDDVTSRLPTPRLAARLLRDNNGLVDSDILARFAPDAPLRASGAIRILAADRTVPIADRPAKLDERLAAHLVGADLTDATVPGRDRIVPVPAADPGRPEAVATLRRLLAASPDAAAIVCGSDAAEVLAWAVEQPVLLLDARDAADGESLGSGRMRTVLEGAWLALEVPAAHTPEDVMRVRRGFELAGPQVLACARRTQDIVSLGGARVLVIEVPPPSPRERRALWAAHVPPGDVAEAASKFRLSMSQIAAASRIATLAARGRGAETPTPADLEQGAREASRTELGELATLLTDSREWDELVLPQPQHDQLRSIAAYLRHSERVLGDWGYADSGARPGLKALFAGDSGTGKTLAAQVVAADLGLDVFRIDLATVVSKYIGETERNLDRIFNAAEGSNAILFFDEADALFGKRSEVKDAHDRYANIEVSYLLQRMETYCGAVLLATNYRRNVDDAFFRRLDFVVDFPFPEPADRVRLWKRLLPSAAPIAADVDVDTLGARFELSGGSIRNASVAAAFMAADDGGVIEMRHLMRAIAAEYRKNGRLTLASRASIA